MDVTRDPSEHGHSRHGWSLIQSTPYFDSSAGGAASLLLAGPQNGRLDAYERAATRPVATVLCQDAIESNLMGHDGDFRPRRGASTPRLTMAAR